VCADRTPSLGLLETIKQGDWRVMMLGYGRAPRDWAVPPTFLPSSYQRLSCYSYLNLLHMLPILGAQRVLGLMKVWFEDLESAL
jgi:hypothetical protein